jgi:hypothetical protein
MYCESMPLRECIIVIFSPRICDCFSQVDIDAENVKEEREPEQEEVELEEGEASILEDMEDTIEDES